MKRTSLIGVVVAFMATIVFASMGGSANGMGGMSFVVAPDGTVIAVRGTSANEMGGDIGREIVAISPTGSVLWTWSGDEWVHRIDLAGRYVLATTGSSMGDEMGYHDGEAEMRGSLVALAVGSGTEVWTVDLPGIAVAIESTTSQIYVLVQGNDPGGMGMQTAARKRGAMHGPGMQDPGTNPTNPGTNPQNPGMDPQQPGGGMGDSTLIAISYDGAILWELPLTVE